MQMTREQKAKWIVTADGMEAEGYHIPADRLTEMRDSKYEWPMHLCIKTWFDVHDFFPEFEAALEVHGHALDEKALVGAWEWCLKKIEKIPENDAIAREMFPEKFKGGFGMWTVAQMRAVSDEQKKRRLSSETPPQ
ncbi:hypothetical protein Arad_4257 [Rhizobium rhizogenes K84]|uniref:Uncharacterized protein n=2 Tax=Rhizobium rhizogenes TaxID=359 RepID=B9JBV4_RHIR8|nr:hypothetical protein Arad_4257 [Rhizobium rhizogenes K84]